MILTSAGQRGDAARCRELGISGYLTKPAKRDELLAMIQRAASMLTSGVVNRLVTRHSLRESERRLRVLLAEDNTVNQRLAVRMLEKMGHSIVVAENGAIALEEFSSQVFDIVLMDVQMPEMDGLEATEAIREFESHRGGHVPIIALTARAMKGDRQSCIAAGMDDYLPKPFRAEDLSRIIRRYVRSDMLIKAGL